MRWGEDHAGLLVPCAGGHLMMMRYSAYQTRQAQAIEVNSEALDCYSMFLLHDRAILAPGKPSEGMHLSWHNIRC